MKRFYSLFTLSCILFTTTAFAQLKFTVKAMPDADTYGVYLKPCGDITPSSNTITGTGQATVVLPKGNNLINFKTYAGVWVESGDISGPEESPNNNYFSYGFLADSPQIVIEASKETLLFTFEVDGTATGAPKMLDNDTDPFASFPNSVNSNPGNEMSMLDFGVSPVGYYYYSGNYTIDDPASCQTVIDTTQTEPTDTTLTEPTDTTLTEPTDTTSNTGGTTTPTLEESIGNEMFTLAPNPTSHWVNVTFSTIVNYSEGTVRLWTVHGIVIGEMVRNGQGKMTLNVGALPNGIYYISYESEGKVLQRERFLKQ